MISAPENAPLLEARAKIKAILFDLDGTLMDTDDAVQEVLARRLDRFSALFPGRNTARFVRRLMLAAEGPVNRAVTFLDLLGWDDAFFALVDRVRRLRGGRAQEQFVAVEGVIDMVHCLCGRYRLGIITTRSRGSAAAFVRQFGVEGLFQVIAGRQDTRRLKPHPEPIRHAVDLLGLTPVECVMVGDTAVDIVSAKAAGSYAVGVLCGLGERTDLATAGADLILDTTAQLTEWF